MGKHWQTYAQSFGNPVVEGTINDYGFYAQDQWKATDRLTVNLGLRYERPTLPQPTQCNQDYPQTCHVQTGTKNFEPRIGLAYRLERSRRSFAPATACSTRASSGR